MTIPGIEPGMTRAEKMKVYRRRWAVKPEGRASASECQSRYMVTDKGKTRTARANAKHRDGQDAWRKSETGKASVYASNQKQKANGNVSKYWKSPKGKALAARGYQKKKADPGKLLQLRIGTRICQSMSMPIEECVVGSSRLAKYTEFKTSQEVKDHLESTFDGWMNWTNYGKHRLLGPRVWQVGHRIPLCSYDCNDPKDLVRCWSKANLFAQEGKENIELNSTMPPTHVLMRLRNVWPLAWNGVCP